MSDPENAVYPWARRLLSNCLRFERQKSTADPRKRSSILESLSLWTRVKRPECRTPVDPPGFAPIAIRGSMIVFAGRRLTSAARTGDSSTKPSRYSALTPYRFAKYQSQVIERNPEGSTRVGRVLESMPQHFSAAVLERGRHGLPIVCTAPLSNATDI